VLAPNRDRSGVLPILGEAPKAGSVPPRDEALVTADLAFNVQSTAGALSQVMLRLNDFYKSFGPSRVLRSGATEAIRRGYDWLR
jgi:hypothetical protein